MMLYRLVFANIVLCLPYVIEMLQTNPLFGLVDIKSWIIETNLQTSIGSAHSATLFEPRTQDHRRNMKTLA